MIRASLFAGLGYLYPLLAPPAAALLGWELWDALRGGECRRRRRRRLVETTIALVAGALVTAGSVLLVSRDRQAPAVLLERELWPEKLLSLGLVLLPLLLAAGWTVSRAHRRRPYATGLLMSGTVGSILLYLLFHLPGWRNEYKYMFTAALCLAPFAGLATSRLRSLHPRSALPAFLLLTCIMTLPSALRIARGYPLDTPPGPRVELSGFDLELAGTVGWQGVLTREIRAGTPRDAVVVLESCSLHLPTLMQRPLYAPCSEDRRPPGVGMTSRETLLTARGYDPELLERCLEVVRAFYRGTTEERASAVEELLGLGRPVVVVVESARRPEVVRWLRSGAGRIAFRGDGVSAWLLSREERPSVRRSARVEVRTGGAWPRGPGRGRPPRPDDGEKRRG